MPVGEDVDLKHCSCTFMEEGDLKGVWGGMAIGSLDQLEGEAETRLRCDWWLMLRHDYARLQTRTRTAADTADE